MKQPFKPISVLARRNAIALLALLVALSGSTYAADAVTTKLRPKNSVASAQVINGSLQKVDFSKKVKGARGAQGPQGAAGPAGSAGPQGPKGDTGDPGASGQPGAQGPQGTTGPALLRSPPGANVLTTLYTAGDVSGTSATIGVDGLGLISYYDDTSHDLKVAHCDNAACTSASKWTLDDLVSTGLYTSVTIGTDGLGLISYQDSSSFVLKVAHCDNIACTSASKNTLGGAGEYSSMTIGTDGLGLISYPGSPGSLLSVAHCQDVACSTWSSTTIDAIPVGTLSVTIGGDGLGLISYFDVGNGDLKVAHCDNLACTAATKTTIDDGGGVGVVGSSSSVTIGGDGLGLISYYDQTNQDLKVAHCNNVVCNGAIPAILSTLDSAGQAGLYTSATTGTDGLGLISYAGSSALKVAHCNNSLCAGASLVTLESAFGFPKDTSATVGADGLGLIGYASASNDLKVAHCSSTFCVPYFRRR
jgi:hypothetical protein